MNPRYSASRLSCFEQCKVKYYNDYILEVVGHGGKSVDVQAKGLDCHEIMENFDSTKTFEDLCDMIKAKQSAAEYDIEKYDLLKSAPRLWSFWQTQVKAREDLGYKTSKEGWKNFSISKAGQFVGAIDLCLYGPDGDVWIFDYKTGGTAKMSDEYGRQLMIYAIAIAQQEGIPFDQIPDRIHLALVYPMAGVKDEEATDPEVAEKMMLKTIKTLNYTKADLEGVVQFVDGVVDGTSGTDWEAIDRTMDAKMGFYCSWCPYIGTIKSQSEIEGFKPCDLTYKNDYRSQRGLTFITKAESKRLQAELNGTRT
jgi:hypothetical protein